MATLKPATGYLICEIKVREQKSKIIIPDEMKMTQPYSQLVVVASGHQEFKKGMKVIPSTNALMMSVKLDGKEWQVLNANDICAYED